MGPVVARVALATNTGFPADTCGSIRMAIGPVDPIMHRMSPPTSYAVAWRKGHTRFVGYARLEPAGLRLEGRDADGSEGLRTIGYEDVLRIDVNRMNGHRGIVLELAGDDQISITSLDRPGSLGEMAEQLRGRTVSPHR